MTKRLAMDEINLFVPGDTERVFISITVTACMLATLSVNDQIF